jgi:pyruvate formate lyase activating enzyme
MKMVLVTNGFLSPKPWDRIMEFTDGANIDVKGFTERFYRDLTGSRLEPILRNVKSAFERSVHVELTYLVIPGYNDSPEEVDEYLDWVKENLSDDIPLHFTRFHPDYKMSDVPATPVDTLERIMKQCERAGMKYFYMGNVMLNDYNNTRCPECGKVVIKRSGFSIKTKGVKHGKCSSCGAPIKGVFDS